MILEIKGLRGRKLVMRVRGAKANDTRALGEYLGVKI